MRVRFQDSWTPGLPARLVCILALTGAMCVTAAALLPPAGTDLAIAESAKRDVAWLAGAPSLLPGTPSHDRVRERLLDEVRKLPGIRVWTQTYEVYVPHYGEARIQIESGPAAGNHRVFPVWPSSVRLQVTPKDGLAGPLVYVKEGEWEDLRPRSLRGAIAVMEITGGGRWTAVANAGAKAIVLLGRPDENFQDARAHFVPLPICLPRYYMPAGPAADALRRTAQGVRAVITCRGEWRPAPVGNILALVPARAGVEPRQAVAVAVQMDDAGLVPELSPGADQAVDAAFALNMLRWFAAHPAERPLLFVFLDGQSINERGMREFLAAAAVTPSERKRWREEDEERLEEVTRDRDLARKLIDTGDPLAHYYERRFRRLHQYIKDEVAREVVAVDTVLQPARLRLHRASGAEKEALRRQVEELDQRRFAFFGVQRCLLTSTPVRESLRELAETLWKRVRTRLDRQVREAQARVQVHEVRDALRRELVDALGLEEKDERPLEFLLGIDLSDCGVAVGPMLYGRYLFFNESANAASFTRWLSDLTRSEDVPPLTPRELVPALDLTPLSGMDSPDSYTVGDTATLTGPAQSFGTQAVTWATLNAERLKTDTPLDTPDRLDWDRLLPQMRATFYLVHRMANDPSFRISSSVVPRWNRAQGSIVDQAPGEPVPRLPMPDYLVVLMPGSTSPTGRAGVYWLPPVPGIRRLEFSRTAADGTFIFDALPGHVGWAAVRSFAQAYKLDDDGNVIRAVDLKKAGKGINLNFDVRSHDPTPLRAVMFTCVGFQAFDFYDPRFLLALPAASLLDARRGGEPRRLNYMLSGAMLSAFVEPDIRWELILRVGVTRNRMALLNMAPPEEWRGRTTRQAIKGFDPQKPMPRHPLYQAALDLYRLDTKRVRDYRRAGITSKAIDMLRKRTEAFLKDTETAIQNDDGSGLYRAAGGALANELRAYQAVRDMANDVIRGAIFLLLVLAPFAYAMERLIFASPHVYRQLAGVGAIFTVMTLVLWSFHPAFRITSQPLMIIMAFAIILMSGMVISVVFNRFETELEEIRSGRAESSGAQTSRLGVLVTAVRLGIANMRKRKLRTALTGITVMLITFALLCFTSTSRYVGHKQYELRVTAPYTGVLVRQPSNRAMPIQAATYLEQVAGEGRPVVRRFWWNNPWNPQWRLHVRNPANGKQVSLLAALGLDAAEDQLTRVRDFFPNWGAFAARTDGCYLASETAEELGLKPGDTVVFAGRRLRLIGVFDAGRVDREYRGLDGQLMMPMDYSALGDEQRRMLARGDLEMVEVEMESGAGLEPDVDLPRVSGSSAIVVSADVLEHTSGCSLRSLAVGAKSEEDAHSLTMELAQRLAFPVYYGAAGKPVHVVASTPLFPKAPKSVLIPLAIAALIIFNTMLSSIAERRREIYVYTSLGLAPLHVGFLFLAEAATYGLMGSIFGYIVGQGVATVFSKMGWMGGITLNYSGTQAIAVMTMVLLVVVLSSLVPAYLAGRLAAPSNEMTWRVPEPDGDVIRDMLPFTATPRTANGVMAFLLEYLDAHREGVIGNFSTDDLHVSETLIHGRSYLTIEGAVWLAPYDLGIRQDIRIRLTPTDEEDVLGFEIELIRRAGQPQNWYKLNRVFLGDLRRQLLGWRKLKPERILAYIAQAAETAPAVS